ncbi:cation diffusion facilitator family transporter [Reichenbachiella carrageenanivorans]|uniref:Cation diffusion facilitator family transporter n=1 Tax=Reichenbachiella carrageenanivorans TaxID=2979869 RepID=A0ABY6CYK4_9BACT|nr:cation diffusion facilitator family transporter [Reichenbachiella carrageenanivorans]UXX78996.1 cation diffusion facilitator family transporter [Reichenbachiella carrageenanivorans]
MPRHHHGHDHNHHDVDNIKTAFFLNLGFTIVEIIGGLYVNSVAIISDAIHDFGDSVSLGISWYFQKISKKGRTHTFSYGYKRFSVLSAILNSVVLLAGSIFILRETIPRLIQPEQPDAKGMILLAILGVIVNGAAVLKTRKGKTANEKVVSLHLLEDVLGWIAVLIGSIVMSLTNFPILDPILSLMIAGYILFNVFRNLKASLKIILQSIPPEVDTESLKKQLQQITHVDQVHDMHTWTMDGEYHVMTLHLVLDEDVDLDIGAVIKAEARRILTAAEIDHVTIELESPQENCGHP